MVSIKPFFSKLKNFVVRYNLHIYLLLLLIASLGFWIRIQNWDYVYGKKLSSEPDTYLFYRYATYIVKNGSLPKIDNMRYFPLGFETSYELQMVPLVESLIYYTLHPFGLSLLQVADLYPPIIFFLIVIVFFFVVRELTGKNEIALIASLLLTVMPFSIQRTSLGFADKEPIATLFIFLALYFYIKAKRSENFYLPSILSGLFTLLGLLSWGGTKYLILTLGFSELLFSVKDLKREERIKSIIIQLFWILPWFVLSPLYTIRYSYRLFLVTPIYVISFAGILNNALIISLEELERRRIMEKIPYKQIVSVVLLFFVGIAGFLYLHGFGMLSDLINRILYPLGYSRFAISVAENRPLQLGEWQILLPIFGIFLIFFGILREIGLEFTGRDLKKVVIEVLPLVFIGGYSFVISRFPHTDFFLAFLFLSFASLFVLSYYKKKFSFESIYLLSFLLLTLLGARGAARLAYLVSYILPIFYGIGIYYLSKVIAEKLDIPRYSKYSKYVLMILFVILITGLPSFPIGLQYYKISLELSKSQTGLDPYWYISLGWVKDNTEKDSVFAHWWDYGYLVQTIGERTTILDGGNVIVFWDHLFGRHVLCGKSVNESLEFLYAHSDNGERPVYLLIDPSDVYKAYQFSRIGSDQFYDRWMKIGVYVPVQKNSEGNITRYILIGDAAMLDGQIKVNNMVFSISKEPKYYFNAIEISIDNRTGKITDAFAYIGTFDKVYAKIPIKYLAMKLENTTRIIEINPNGKGMLYAAPAVYINAFTGEVSMIGQGFLYITDKAFNYTWVRLYFLGDYGEYFEPVYEYYPGLLKESIVVLYDPSTGNVYHVEYRGPLKIWKVKFPKGYEISDVKKCIYNARNFWEVKYKCNATWYKNELEV